MIKVFLLLFIPLQLAAQPFTKAEIAQWQQQSQRVTIIRDNWGIPHIYGKTDADVVFGLLYAQCEDDFKRVETNYIEKLGRLSEVKGENELYNDLLIRLVIDSTDAIKDYNNSPAWFKKLLDAFAAGVNYYIYKNPLDKPALLHRFQPWYALLWTDGSIGAINTAGLSAAELKGFYTGSDVAITARKEDEEEVLTGSNGFAIAPSKTASGHAILYINPHVTFYFRPEVHVVSEEGLNAYGAVTWGQFFVYQGFNEHCGWMHTSSAVDIADLYAEKVSKQRNGWVYEYDHAQKPVTQKKITINYKAGNSIESKTINALFTQHGPVMAKRDGQWLSVKSNNRSLNGLMQCWLRTKTTSFAAYKKVMDMLANTSNNTVYADAEGNIAYWHGNYIPVRDKQYNWSKPVDGTTSATEWKGLHTVDESIHIYNPSNGWIQNCNSTPYTAAGPNSPKKENYPAYMAPDGENFRGINAVRVLSKGSAYTIDKVIASGYDTYLAAFEKLIPALVNAFEKAKNDSQYASLAAPIATLKGWDLRTSETSVATTVAIEWAQLLRQSINRYSVEANDDDADQVTKTERFAAKATVPHLLNPLITAVNTLKSKFGDWQIPWGQINRYQRLTGDVDGKYDDSKPSLPVGFASSAWGMLPSYTSTTYAGTNKRYGLNGNSFICAVEFGKTITAKSLLAGGESGHPDSKHFTDQGLMYTKGQFKTVLFYKQDVLQHAEKTYHPGE
jgi:acyl-homoserine-lactone acylase